MKFLVPLDLVQNELQNARVQNLSNAPASGVAGQIYYNTAVNSLFFYDGTSWVDTKSIGDLGIDDLEDVVITSPQGGQFLVYDSATSKWVNTAVDLTDLDDVTIVTPSSGDVLYFDGEGWVNERLSTDDVDEGENLYYTDERVEGVIGDASVSDLSDVSVATPEAGDLLVFDGEEWVNRTLSLDELDAAEDDVDLNENRIVNLAAPTDGTDAANKAYVDSVAQGLDVKNSVRAATTGDITLSGTQTVDGVVLVAGDRVLVRSQTAGAENGIYVVASGAWTRADDADTSAKLNAGAFVFVEEGTNLADTGWVLTTDEVVVVGTTPLVWAQFSGAGTFLAGTGLTLTGNTFSITPAGVTETELATDSVTTAKIKDANVTEQKLDSSLANKINAKTDSVSATVGDGTATSFTVTHNLGTRVVQVVVHETSSPYAQVIADVEHTSTSAVTVKFATAPTTNQYTVVVVG
jgi:hypothetical protein